MEDVNKHYQALFSYLSKERIQEAVTESHNLYKNVYAVLNGHCTKLTALCCLIRSVGDINCIDISDEGLEETAELLKQKNITWGEIDTQLEEVKKK